MKTIGLIGGMSWESTQLYYRIINEKTRDQLGGLHSAQVAMISVDFAPIEAMQHSGDWQGTADVLARAAVGLENAGADFFLICTNTMHQVANEVQSVVSIPLVHIADATAQALTADGVKKIGLLGTAFTMEMDFYRSRIEAAGIEVVVPEMHDRQSVHDIIYQELCLGVVDNDSREVYKAVIDRMKAHGIEGVILGCTEIGMLIGAGDTDLPLYDTTLIHAEAAVNAMLGN